MASFGAYTLGTVLGAGDMGTTYEAVPADGGAPVALKILDKVDSTSLFQREAALEIIEFTISLSHPRLHPVSAVLSTDEKIGLVSPLVAGRSLLEVVKAKGKFPTKVAFNLVAQVATGLSYLHKQEVAHGGVKPSNLLWVAENEVALTDLSMAHLRELGLVPPQPSNQHLLFAPPEREYHAAPEIAGDVYSLAVLAYWLLAGVVPFDTPEPEARGPVGANGLPSPVVAVLRRAINPHLHWRYLTLTDFMAALKDAAQGQVDKETEKAFGYKAPPPPPQK